MLNDKRLANSITSPAQSSAKAARNQSTERSQTSSKSVKTKNKSTSIVDILALPKSTASGPVSDITITRTTPQPIGKYYKC